MKAHTSIIIVTLLLIVPLTTTTAASRTPVKPDDETEQITPEEDKEARELVGKFMKRLQETNDFAPLIKEFYVDDFADRLQQMESPGDLFSLPIEHEVEKQASREQLLKGYQAMMSFLYMGVRLYEVKEIAYKENMRKHEGKEEDGQIQEPTFKQIFTPEVIDLFKSDPTLKDLLTDDLKDNNNAPQKTEAGNANLDVEKETATINSLERLDDLISVMNKINAILREQVKTLPPSPMIENELSDSRSVESGDTESVEENQLDSNADTVDKDKTEPISPEVQSLQDEEFGAPKGTRIICITPYIFHIELIRVEGQLKILNVYFDAD